MEIADVVKKPFEDIGKLIIGIILAIVPVINFVVIGFGLELANKPKKLPDFSIEQWILGLKTFLVGLVYGIITFAVYLVIMGIAFMFGLAQFDISNLAAIGNLATIGNLAAIGVVGAIAGVLLLLVAAPVFTRASLALSKKGSIGDALRIGEILGKTYRMEFLGTWIVAVLLGLGASVVIGLIPFLGWIASNYISTVIFWTYLGANYKF